MEEGVGFQNHMLSCYLGAKSRKRSKCDFYFRFIQQFTKRGGLECKILAVL